MNRYQSYKPSGVEWIGEIPEEWSIMKLGYLGRLKSGNGFPENLQGREIIGDFPFFKVSDTNNEGNEFYLERSNNYVSNNDYIENKWYLFPKETVVFPKIGMVLLMNKRRILNQPSFIDNNMMGFIPNSLINFLFSFYLLKLIDFKNYCSDGTVPSIGESQISSIRVVLPPLSEQHQIVQFLDSKTELIDKLISTKERKITLLKEQRTSLINRVVTKGLNPNVKMKDSGVEWIGEIPDGWKVGRLGYYSNVYRGSGYQYLNQVDDDFEGRKERVVRISDISEFNPIWCEYLEQFENYRIKKDEILMGGTGHYFGKSIYVTEEMEGLIHSYNIIRIVVKNLNTKFIQYYISSQKIREQMDMSVLGSGQPFIDLQGLKDLIILIPENKEQLQIVEYLDGKTKEIDVMVQLEQKKIDLLKEYRQSLISEVVTGKIKVTN